jgi:glycosyltransferase involved in cell wall biosynthesis
MLAQLHLIEGGPPATLAPHRSSGERLMRVLHLVSSDAFAGLERHVLRLCHHLRDSGVDAILMCPPSATRMRREATAAGVPSIPDVGPWPASGMVAMRRCSPTILHVHDGRAAVAGVVLASRRTKIVRTQHFVRPASVDRHGPIGSASIEVHRLVNHRVAAYIAVSQLAADNAVARGEVPRHKVTVIPPGVLLASEPAVAAARRARAETKSFVVAFVGRFESEKRIDVLLEALAEARRAEPRIRAIIAGGGQEEAALKRLASDLALEGFVEWPGWLPEPDDVLSRAHLYVNPWPDEGFGMAMAEAMGYELPVVAPASGASPELVEPLSTGMLVPPRDPRALAAVIIRLARVPDEARRMGSEARRRALRQYGVPRTAAATAALYSTLALESRR